MILKNFAGNAGLFYPEGAALLSENAAYGISAAFAGAESCENRTDSGLPGDKQSISER